jgi:5-formyltetrahydrofolate cyclo-ligase
MSAHFSRAVHSGPGQKSLKSRLRKDIRRKRAGIEAVQRMHWDTAINQHLDEYSRQANPAVVAAYLAFDGEPDLMPSLAGLEDRGVKLALPVIHDAPGKAVITFRHWSLAGKMQQNRYGIAEPVGTKDISVTDIDLVLLPLVGWDKAGGRLGMGASFYDRLFKPFQELGRPVRVGIGYELQYVESIPTDRWDIRLHGVLTENGWFTCKG